jgi:hypothetical protein
MIYSVISIRLKRYVDFSSLQMAADWRESEFCHENRPKCIIMQNMTVRKQCCKIRNDSYR